MSFFFKYLLRKLFFKYSYQSEKGTNPIVIYNDWIGKNIILDGFYEKQIVETILSSFEFEKNKFSCVDVGSNIGNHIIQFKDCFKDVVGFEPQRKTFKILKLNTENYSNVSIYNYGIAQNDKKIKFYIPKNNLGNASPQKNKNDCLEETVELKNYDNLFNQCCAYIKIDVEGYELDVIKGMKETILKHKPIISFEMRDYSENSKNKLIDYLKDLGYNDYYVPKVHPIKKFIKSKNTFSSFLKRLVILFVPYDLNKLVKINIFNQSEEYSLITTENVNSSFRLNV